MFSQPLRHLHQLLQKIILNTLNIQKIDLPTTTHLMLLLAEAISFSEYVYKIMNMVVGHIKFHKIQS